MFQVRNFGNDRDYSDIDEMIEGLREHYRGMSVAIHVRTPRYGMTRPFFVDVTAGGELFESYSENGYVRLDTNLLREAAGC